MMDGLQMPIPQRMMLVRITLVCSVVISLLLTLPLWTGAHTFPPAPLADLGLSQPISDISLLIILILCLTGSMFLNIQRTLILTGLLAATVLVLGDVNRLQPWIYVYCSMLLVYVFYNGRVDDSNRYTSFFIILQFVLASVYFFCGLNQLNCLFVETEYASLISPLKHLVSERQFLFFLKIGYVAPYIMMFVGIGLIISPIRYLAITLAMFVHIALLILLFPSSHYEYALWFANLPFAIILLLLFSGKTKQRYFSPTFLLQRPLFYMVMVLFVLMPFFNNGGYWPDYLSFNFKSGNNKKVIIQFSEKIYLDLPRYVKYFAKPVPGGFIMDYKDWSIRELRCECYPGSIVFNSILASIAADTRVNVKEIELIEPPRSPLLCKQ
jgi:hypothetical protein